MTLWVSLFVFKGSEGSWGRFSEQEVCEPVGLALNKGIRESETWGSPVLVGAAHIPSDCSGSSPRTMVVYVRLCESDRSVRTDLCLLVRGENMLGIAFQLAQGERRGGRHNAEWQGRRCQYPLRKPGWFLTLVMVPPLMFR